MSSSGAEREWPSDNAIGAGDAGLGDSGCHPSSAGDGARDLRRRNALGLALRFAGAPRGQVCGVQSAQGRTLEVG